MKHPIPTDILRYRNKRFFKLIVKCATLIAGISCIVFFSKDVLLSVMNKTNILLLWALLSLVCLFAMKLPQKLIGRSWAGEVIGEETNCEMSNKLIARSIKTTHEGHYAKSIIVRYYTIHKGNGQDTTYKEIVSNADVEHEKMTYKVGDRVLHVHGTDYLCVIGRTMNNRRNCVVCGTLNPDERESCIECGHTLIKA